jgi:5'-phosphate synthase pdxT subunit
MTIGILAIQGDYAEHEKALGRLGVTTRFVKHAEALEGLQGLILPGGESTTMMKFMTGESLLEPVRRFFEQGGAIYGTCAGAILLAKHVSSPSQTSLDLLDISIERNGYGRQVQSHVSYEPCPALGDEPLEMVFIRAPVIHRVGESVEILARHRGTPVFVRQGRIMATTFHPELSSDHRVHRYFVESVVLAGSEPIRLPTTAVAIKQ